ncbi:alpha/beta hydrolase fold domain-containing protein [Nocardia sp. NPDC049190]|uniref:alpha/beta hydrolase n=1 Tax=Nocardia sp. NPDC049190 TaxID=3155650 RepID=UPI0033CC6BB4
MASEQSDQLAELAGATRERMSNPNLDLHTIRDICDALAEAAGKEPEGVSYCEVDAGGVPALWCIPAGCDDQSVVLFNHAGGTVVFSMASDRKAAGHLAKAAGIRALVLGFRRSPENKFPAQQDDVETAYRWLLSQGYHPDKIASAGHSVGGNLAVSLAIRLRDRGLPLPAAILSVSGWYDTELKNPTYQTNAETDKILSMPLAQFFRDSWLGGTDIAHNDPRVNLLYADLAGLPPINIYYGAHEVLVGEIHEFADRAKTAGLDTSLHGVADGQHIFLLGAGRVPETDAAITEMGQWLRSKLAVNISRRPAYPA